MLKGLLYLLVMLFSFTFCYAEMYKWVDAQGQVNYGDSCPLEECETLGGKASPQPTREQTRRSQERMKSLIERTRRMEEARKQTAERKQREKEAEQAEIVALKRKCARYRQNLHTFLQQRPAYTIDHKGEYIYIEDAAREKEILRLREFIEKNCRWAD